MLERRRRDNLRIGLLILIGISILLTSGCVDQKQIEGFQTQINLQLKQINDYEAVISNLTSQQKDYELTIQELNHDIQEQKEEMVQLQTEHTAFTEKIEALENELQLFNETALEAIQKKEDYQKKILSLKDTQALRVLTDAYEGSLEEQAASHYGQCLYIAVKREGVSELIQLLEKESFIKVDGVIGHFASALKSAEDLAFKSQLMIEAASIDSSQSPTTLYFYARVLYYLSRS